jgi:hypothetical protein
LPHPGWAFLARGEQENNLIARCPGGHMTAALFLPHTDFSLFPSLT